MTSSIGSNASRWLTAILAASLVLALLVGSSQNTARAIDAGETDIAYVADGYNFPDALMGATLAGLNTAPMLGVRSPTTGDIVPPETAAELDRLTNNKASKLDTIYVFGGSAAVSDKVVGELGAWANNVARIAGANRFETMAEISQALPTKVKDSDLLDGMDSTDFLGATDKAADSDLLDGMDSTDFLGATEQAADSDLLDGMDSTDLLLPTTLPEGMTLTGSYAVEGFASGSGEEAQDGISFPIRLANEPTEHFIPVGGTAPAGCPGSSANPQADPGHLCVYESFAENQGQACIVRTDTAWTCDAIGKTGGGVWIKSNAAGRFVSTGTWAVTAGAGTTSSSFSTGGGSSGATPPRG